MSFGERIKKLRKVLDLTQQEFADKIKVSRSNIATYEVGKNNPADAVVSLICREFNVSEAWLRTGEGEMFVSSPNGVLDELAQKYGLSSRGKIIIERFLHLKPDIQEAVADYIEEIAAAFKEKAPAPDAAGQEQTRMDVSRQEPPGKEEAENQKMPIPVDGDGLEAQKKMLMELLDKMDPGQLQMYYDQMHKLKKTPTGASPFSALVEADQKAPEFDTSGLT